MLIAIIVIVIVLFIIIFAVFESGSKERQDKIESAKANAMSTPYNSSTSSRSLSFTPSRQVNVQSEFYFAVDDYAQKAIFISPFEEHRFDFKDVLSASIQIDGKTVSSRSLASTIGGAVVGGIIGGGVGAIIGGANAKSTSIQKVDTIYVVVLLNNKTIKIRCLNTIKCDSNSSEYAMAMSKAEAVMRILNDAIESQKVSTTSYISAPKSAIEELKELSKMLEDGYITEAEYNKLKSKIINKD